MGNMIIIALILDERQKHKKRLKKVEKILDSDALLLEPLLKRNQNTVNI